ncbi:MFS polyamine transporter [Cyathus striatus]|nr:MFS polyamine transporter [Cyathus striatus]
MATTGPSIENTPRSSFTLADPGSSKPSRKPSAERDHHAQDPDMTPLEREITRHETEFEQYGGDDIHEPEPKTPPTQIPSFLPQKKVDPNQVTWDGPDDPANPQNWSRGYKWLITATCIIMSVNVTFASSAPSSAALRIKAEFGTSSEVSYLVTSVFLLGYVFGPMFWGPGSELIGRKPIFTFALSMFLSGFFAVAPMTNCGGVIADIWDAAGRGPATSLFTFSVFLGPVLGPIVSGFIANSNASWRWIFWVMMMFAGTYAPVLLLKKAKRLRKEDPVGNKEVFAEHEKEDGPLWVLPFVMLSMEPILLLITIYLSVVYGFSTLVLFQAFPIIFVLKRHLTISEDGLMFISVGIGTTAGSLINRLFGAMLGSPLLVVGCFWLGWTGEYASIPWYVPALAGIVIGCSISLIFMSFLSYIVDTYLMFSASAFAANTVIRSAVAAAFPLFTVQMFTGMGVNWACTLIGLVALLFAPSPFLFYKYGPIIRQKSKFAPCIDLKIAAAMKAAQAGQSEKV